MKFDIDKKHPLTSVEMIPESDSDKYLTEEQLSKLKKTVAPMIRWLWICVVMSLLMLPMDLIGLIPTEMTTLRCVILIVGACAAVVMLVGVIFLCRIMSAAKKLCHEFENESGGSDDGTCA